MKNSSVFRIYVVAACMICSLGVHSQTEVWSPMNGGLSNLGLTQLLWNGDLYVGGSFTQADGNSAMHIAKWNGSTWTTLGQGFNGAVYCLAVYNNQLYAGGAFTMADGHLRRHIARWNGSSWDSLSTGTSGAGVHAMAVYNGELYAGGQITSVGPSAANGIAKWNGSAWSTLGSGTGLADPWNSTNVSALLVHNNKLYVGGYFETADAITCNNIAAWDGSNWSAVGPGFFGDVLALAEFQGKLFAGGSFVCTTEYVGTYHLASWDDNAWTGAGGGTNDLVYSLFAYGSKLYVGGMFTYAGSNLVNHIVTYNGSIYSGIGGADGAVYSICGDEGIIFAAGDFLNIGSVSATFIAKWSSPGVGVEENNMVSGINLFPNPASDFITIASGNSSGEKSFQLFNAYGELVQEEIFSSGAMTIDLRERASGSYHYVLFENGEIIYSGSLIVE